jgi:hypothetical protein
MMEIRLTVSSVYVVPAKPFSPSISAIVPSSALALTFASGFVVMDSAVSLEAF